VTSFPESRREGRAVRLLGPDGPLARALPGYEARDAQLAMAEAVEGAFADDRVLLCEAGTGTGKTLAYLVPAILSGKKVVVSTATKALEEQIFFKDLPLIAKNLGLVTTAALVKGLGNYLCLRRFEELRAGAASLADASTRRSLPLLEAWAQRTKTGDVGELEGLREGDPLWREVCSSSETRVGADCEFFERCFVTRMKREAAEARIVVVNHHLFFADLAVKAQMGRRGAAGGALPPYDAVIFDEAHQLEDIATDFLGVRVSRARIEAMVRDADRAFVGARFVEKAGPGARPGKGTGLTDRVRVASDELFALLARLGVAQAAEAGARAGRPTSEPPAGEEATESVAVKATLPRDVWQGSLLTAYHRLDTELEALEHFADANAVDEPVRLVASRAGQLRDDAAKIVEPATHQVTWVEVRARSVSVGASPIDVGGFLRKEVFERVGAAVLTSATLSTGGDAGFRFLRSRVGLAGDDDSIGVEELRLPSPFDFEGRSLLYTPRDLPETSDPAFLARAADRIGDLLGVTGGGAFVLCTSLRAMKGLADALRTRWAEPPLVQGEAPKGVLLRRFREDGHAVLVATMSFWEGVDVPGDALRLVVIEKIPFAVPTEPVVAARSAAIEAAGGNPFVHYSVPQAAITLKQGFGRLLRTTKDHGVVAILDRRIKTKGYGRTLIEGLPPARRTERLEDVRAFWATRPGAVRADDAPEG
jgi:ATP-dependent DNA helicase DinG